MKINDHDAITQVMTKQEIRMRRVEALWIGTAWGAAEYGWFNPFVGLDAWYGKKRAEKELSLHSGPPSSSTMGRALR